MNAKKEPSKIPLRISDIMFKAKDLLAEKRQMSLTVYRKNTVTKIYSEKTNNQDSFIFLFSVAYFNSQRMIDVVKAGLLHKEQIVSSKIESDEEFVSSLVSYLEFTDSIKVIYKDSKICLEKSNRELFELFSDIATMDTVAIHMFCKSLVIFFALCGKNASSNLDSAVVNDYGVATIWE